MFTKKAEGYLSKKRRVLKAIEVLGLGLTIEFTEVDIRRQFAELAKEGHPDVSENPDETIDLNKLRRAKDTLIAYLEDEKND